MLFVFRNPWTFIFSIIYNGNYQLSTLRKYSARQDTKVVLRSWYFLISFLILVGIKEKVSPSRFTPEVAILTIANFSNEKGFFRTVAKFGRKKLRGLTNLSFSQMSQRYNWLGYPGKNDATAMVKCSFPVSSVTVLKGQKISEAFFFSFPRVSVKGVESLWGDCRFILADWGSQYVVDLCYFALFKDFSL